MKLKFKPINFESGRPIAFISRACAERLNIVEGSRVEIIKNSNKFILPVNIIEKILAPSEISFSEEAVSILNVKKGNAVSISAAIEPKSIWFILKKLNNHELTKSEIRTIIGDIVSNSINEAEIAYFVSAVYHNGMTLREIFYLTEAMADTGRIISWGKGKKIADKHSIGGIAGNRTTPIVVAICAAAGIIMPKTSSRAITSASGTADTMETIARVDLSIHELKRVVAKTGACLVWGGALGLAPADDRLIRVERLLNLDPEPQLIASILSKKISVGSTHVLIDIPYGKSAKVSFQHAKKLRKCFKKIASLFRIHLEVVLTKGDEPIGDGVGPVLEMRDVLRVLEQNSPPQNLQNKSIFLAGKILEMMGKAKKDSGEKLAEEILTSGKALGKFNEIISAQGRKKERLVPGPFHYNLLLNRRGKVYFVDNKKINLLARTLGCPTSKQAGIFMHIHTGDNIKSGQPIMTLYAESEKKLAEGRAFALKEEIVKFSRYSEPI